MSTFPWGVHERQGDVAYVTVPEYQPSQAVITLGSPQLYKPSSKAEDISVGLAFPLILPYVLLGAGGLIVVWYLAKKRRKKRKKKKH